MTTGVQGWQNHWQCCENFPKTKTDYTHPFITNFLEICDNNIYRPGAGGKIRKEMEEGKERMEGVYRL